MPRLEEFRAYIGVDAKLDPADEGSDSAFARRDVLAEDLLVRQLRTGRKPDITGSRERLAALGQDSNWDYIAGKALEGGIEDRLLGALHERTSAWRGGLPSGFLEGLARDAHGLRGAVGPRTREGRFLILCASGFMMPAEEAEAARLAGRGIRWELVLPALSRASLVLPVQHNMARLELDARMPPGMAEILARRARGIAERNKRMLSVLNKTAGILAAQGIRTVLLGESALALADPDRGRLRMVNDLDLLFADEDLEWAVGLLESWGYRVLHAATRETGSAVLCLADLDAWVHGHRGIPLPVAEPPGLVASMLARAEKIDDQCHAFVPADMLFHLCMDLMREAFHGKAVRACDARDLLRWQSIDWQALVDTARSARAAPHLAFCLELLSDLDAAIPAKVIDDLRGPGRFPIAASALRRLASLNLFGNTRIRSRRSLQVEKIRFDAMMAEATWLGRLRHVMRGRFRRPVRRG